MVFNPAGTNAFVPNARLRDYYGTTPELYAVSAFAVDATGALTFLGGTYAGTRVEGDLVVHPSGRFGYIRSPGRLQVLGLENPASITVAEVPLPYEHAFNGFGTVFDETGRYAYFHSGGYRQGVPPQNATVFGFGVDPASGALTPLPHSPYATNGAPGGGPLIVDQTHRFPIVPHTYGATVLEIDAATGELAHVLSSPFTPTIGRTASGLVFDPSGKFAYLPDWPSFSVSAYSFDADDGRFSFVGSYSVGGSPLGVVVAGAQ